MIALLWAKDAMHGPALRFFERYIEQEFALHAVSRAEVLVGSTRNGTAQRATERLEALGIRTIPPRSPMRSRSRSCGSGPG